MFRRALLAIDLAGKEIKDPNSKEWKQATKDARLDARTTLRERGAHRDEHGC
jgi:hypothetical protein